MNKEQIEQTLQKEAAEFLKQKFPYDVPEFLNEWFPLAYLHGNPKDNPCLGKRIQLMLSRPASEWNIYEVGMAVNYCLWASPAIFSMTLPEYLEKKIELEEVSAKYNAISKAEEVRQNRKSVALSSMGGQKAKLATA